MNTLKLKNLMRNLALTGAGAIMATLILLPMITSADDGDDQDDSLTASQRGLTYAIRASDRSLSVFTLVEINGASVLTLVKQPVT